MKNEIKSFIVYLAYSIFLVAVIYLGINDSSQLFEWEYLKETSVGLFIIGLIIYLLSYLKLGVKKSSGLNFSGLITTGIYKHIRHPQILGWMLILVGISLYLNSPISSILTLLLWVFFKILFQSIEERQLVKKYGNEYIEYRKKTISGI
jgi:protein-S-isoprenylcysteine O-methyltransferase Ste14